MSALPPGISDLSRIRLSIPVGPDGLTRVIEDVDFSNGLAGWSGLISAGTPNPYPSLAPFSEQGPYSMVLDAGMHGAASTAAVAVKRWGRTDGKFIARHSMGWTANSQNFLRHIRWAMDYQNASNRYWFEIRYRHYDEVGGVVTPLWQIATGTTGAQVYTTIEGLTYEVRWNGEFKPNFDQITIRLDTETKKYEEIEINGVQYDLTSLNLGPTAEARLTSPGSFDNGMNWLLYCENRTNNSSADPRLYVDRVKIEVSP